MSGSKRSGCIYMAAFLTFSRKQYLQFFPTSLTFSNTGSMFGWDPTPSWPSLIVPLSGSERWRMLQLPQPCCQAAAAAFFSRSLSPSAHRVELTTCDPRSQRVSLSAGKEPSASADIFQRRFQQKEF